MALAALIVRIGGDLTGLNKALSQADKDVQRVGKKMTALGSNLTKGLTVPIVAAGAAMAAAAIHVGEYADRLLDLVDMTGLSTSTLQEFRHVARVAGVETDTLAESAIKLTTKLSSGGEQTKELTGALTKLGLKATDANGRLVSMDTLLPEIIGRLQGMRDVTTRNAIAADIFGKSWAELAPILGLGAGAMDKARQEAQRLGLVMSADALEAANNFRIKLDTLKASAGALTREIGMAVLPIMQSLVTLVQENVVPAVRAIVQWFDNLSPSTQTAIGVVAGLVAAFGPLLVVVGSILKFWPLLTVAFTAITGPIGLAVLAIGALTAAGFQMVKHWDAVKLQFTLAWTAMKEAVFFAVDKILAAVAGMAMAFKMTGLAGEILKLSAELRLLADESLAKAGSKISALETKMIGVATAVSKATNAIVQMGDALDNLPAPGPSGDFGWGTMTGGMFGSIGREEKEKSSGFGFKPGDSMGTKISQTIQAGGGGGQTAQMVQAFAAFGPLAAILPVINGALEALEPVVTALIAPLVEIGKVIGDSVAPVLKMLVPVLQLVADLFLRQLAPVLKGITIVLSFVMEGFGWLIWGIGKLVDSLPGISAKGMIKTGEAMTEAARAARRNATATDQATDAVNSFSSALSNIPRVLNINALRHMVTGGSGAVAPNPGSLAGNGLTRTDIYITVPGAGDPTAVAEAVGRVVQRVTSRGGTSTLRVAVT